MKPPVTVVTDRAARLSRRALFSKGSVMPSPLSSRRTVLRGLAVSSVGAAALGSAFATPTRAVDASGRAGSAPGRPLPPPRSLDDRPAPDYDYSRPNRLPQEMTGLWTRTIAPQEGPARSVSVYIPAETPNRAYWIVLAAPHGVSTATFLTRSGWRQHADQAGEGLVVLEPGEGGWGGPDAEAGYVDAAMEFHQANQYYSIFGEHYLVGYDGGAAALERWAAVNPLRVIAQVHLGSVGLAAGFLDEVGKLEYDGTTSGSYTPVVLPDDLDRIRRGDVVLPTWFIDPGQSARDSIDYWRGANDTRGSDRDGVLGRVHRQREDSDRWTTSSSGPISLVAVQARAMKALSRGTTGAVVDFLHTWTRYENFFAYGNQLMARPDLDRMGVEVRTMMVGDHPREYLVYVPRSARRLWGEAAPVVFVWPGNTQTDRVFFDSAQWWKVADEVGCVVVVICETYAASAISVSHRDSEEFFTKLREVVLRRYDVDPTRLYSTGQSAGSNVTQTLAIAKPEYFAAVASTSFAGGPDDRGQVTLDDATYDASGAPIPNYLVYGAGDLSFLAGTLWDDTRNRLDAWADYHLGTHGRAVDDVAEHDAVRSGWRNRFRTWTWTVPGSQVPAVKVSLNEYRSHNNTPEETTMLWEFLQHYRHEVGAAGGVRRWYSPSGFRTPGDEVEIPA